MAITRIRIRWVLAAAVVAVVILGLVIAVGLGMETRREAVPAALSVEAKLVGYTERVRYFPRDATHVKEFEKDYLASFDREWAELKRQGYKGEGLPPASFLVLSGGGDGGAFGAGVLNGWTRTGKRPEFKLVTGVSTGALIAPFAFLGPSYDEQLKHLYTRLSFTDVAKPRWLASALFTDALSDTTPLRRLVESYVTQVMLDAIAAEHAKGRILLIATANLDVRRPVIWNVTEIASLNHPGALQLIHKIMIASAAIPGTFPPVMFDVEANGKNYEEMHVDGGTASQLFVYPAAVNLSELAKRQRTLYIIRNARMDPDWAQVDRRTLPIAMRAIDCLIQNQGIGDLYRVFTIAQRDQIDFNLTFIPPSFNVQKEREFDNHYMKALFETGEELGAAGIEWYKRPPVLLSGVDDHTAINKD